MTAERFDPERLVAWYDTRTGDATLRSVARRLQVDPAVLCRPLTANQADRYATLLGAHPGEVWVQWWSGIDEPVSIVDPATAARRRSLLSALARSALMTPAQRLSARDGLRPSTYKLNGVKTLRIALGLSPTEIAGALECGRAEVLLMDRRGDVGQTERIRLMFIDYAALLCTCRDVGMVRARSDEFDPWEALDRFTEQSDQLPSSGAPPWLKGDESKVAAS